MSIMKLSIISIITTSLFACSSNDNITERVQELSEIQQERITTFNEQQQDKRENEINLAPKWFLSPPENDSTGFFGVGHAKSKGMGIGIKSARLQAEFSLAKMYQQELSGSERSFERGDSDGNVATQTTFLIDKIVNAVPVIGYQVVEQRLIPNNGVFESFVLLKLPYDEFNRVLQEQKKGEIDDTAQQAFDDLERRLTYRRAQKENEREADHQRELQLIEARSVIMQHAASEDGSASDEPESDVQGNKN